MERQHRSPFLAHIAVPSSVPVPRVPFMLSGADSVSESLIEISELILKNINQISNIRADIDFDFCYVSQLGVCYVSQLGVCCASQLGVCYVSQLDVCYASQISGFLIEISERFRIFYYQLLIAYQPR